LEIRRANTKEAKVAKKIYATREKQADNGARESMGKGSHQLYLD